MSTTLQNQAAWLDAPGKQLRVGPMDYPKPQAGEVTLRNYALAINPIDWKIQDEGVWKTDYPSPLGFDMAGEVVEVGEGVGHVQVGDRVAAFIPSRGHALYVAVNANELGILPPKISYIEGSIFPVAFQTAVVGLCGKQGEGLNLPQPSLESKPQSKVLLVWGGSGSVGAMVIQLAKAIGLTVVAVAGKHNFNLCKDCGADLVFDYKSANVVKDVVQAVQSTGLEFAGVFDAIAEEVSIKPTEAIIEALGGGIAIVVVPTLEASDNPSVKRVPIRGQGPLTYPAWRSYFTEALRKGRLKALPPPLVAGKGLESCQAGIDLSRKGVSAKKVVVDLSEL